jgi:hypothetical protein
MSGPILLVLRLLLAAILYAFLGLSLWMLYREFKRQADFLVSRRAPALSLLRQGDQAEAYHFNKPEVNVGRDPGCDCVIEDVTVSAHHAHFSFHHSQWWLEDLGSTNGTFLNEDPVHSALVVTMGDEVRCGGVVFQIAIGEGAASEVVVREDRDGRSA